MTPFRTVIRHIGAFFNRAGSERDIADEMRFHLDMESQTIANSGHTAAAASEEARRRFGNVERYAEELRDERGGRGLDALLQDLRYAFRLIRRAPGFAAMVILTLGLAIGANTAVFSVVNAVLIAPLPIERVHEVVGVFSQNPDASQPRFSISYADYVDWRRDTRSFSDLAIFGNTVLTLTGDGEPERISGLVVTSNFLSDPFYLKVILAWRIPLHQE
jgi:putative ABC transport system permease protein